MVDAVLLPLAVMDAGSTGVDELAAEPSVWDVARGAGPTVEGSQSVLTLPQITAATIGHRALALVDVITCLNKAVCVIDVVPSQSFSKKSLRAIAALVSFQ